MTQLTCFIASAFDHQDIDRIYDKFIKPTLRQLKIKPLRVDRINHNEKIDSKIIELINNCDFGIVDLTNARPSVYYEAGLIEGQNKKVIYICRKDHFKPKPEDIHGVFRIHFDLITKNIIPWTNPDTNFQKKLQSRITFVAKPLIHQLKRSNEEYISRNEFQNLSVSERTKLINNRLSEFAVSKRFRPAFFKNYGYNVFVRNKSILKIEVRNSFLKNDLTFFAYRDKFHFQGHKSKFLIICSLNPLPQKRILHTLKLYKPVSENFYSYEDATLIVFDSISSMYRLETLLNNTKLQ